MSKSTKIYNRTIRLQKWDSNEFYLKIKDQESKEIPLDRHELARLRNAITEILDAPEADRVIEFEAVK